MQYNSGPGSESNSPGSAAGSAGLPYSVDDALAVRPQRKTRRTVGFLIDIIPSLLLGLINLLPVIGWMVHGFLSACYWLLRDITGASLGKIVTGSVVVSEHGGPASTGQKILRNLPLALPGFVGMIPIFGIFFEIILGVVVLGVEVILFLATDRRLGDRLARTTVVRK
jgi:uncharacterized RDD family membrane protein YckC